MPKLLYYGLSRELLGYTLQIAHKKKIKNLSNQLRSIACNKNVVSMSAIQIGQISKYFIVLTKQYLIDNKWKQYDKVKPARYRNFLNARIEDHSLDNQLNWQQCSSYPGIKMLILRPKSVRINYMDEDLKDYSNQQFMGFEGRVIQHEIDHLNGHDFIKVAKQISICDNTLKQKYQKQCNNLVQQFKNSVSQKQINDNFLTNNQFNKLKQFLTYSIIDKIKNE